MLFNSPVDIAIVFGVALLVFGPKKLPELGESLGKGLGNFKKALSNVQEDVSSAIKTDAPVNHPAATASTSSTPEPQAAPAAVASSPTNENNSSPSS